MFEEKMNQIIPAPVTAVENLMTCDGKVKILDFENKNLLFKDNYYHNIKNFVKYQSEALSELNRNLKEYNQHINQAKFHLDNVMEVFGKLAHLSSQAQIVNILK